jgi:Ca2+-binding EF-hand superfamily protein
MEYINERSLVKFFRRNGFFASKEDIQAIIRRFDLNYDEVVTKEELFKFLNTASKMCNNLAHSSELREPLIVLHSNLHHGLNLNHL